MNTNECDKIFDLLGDIHIAIAEASSRMCVNPNQIPPQIDEILRIADRIRETLETIKLREADR